MYELTLWQQAFLFMFVLLYSVCTHVRLGILATTICVYVCVLVEDMYTFSTGNYGNCYLCLFECFFKGYAHL